ncbi:sensor histidine kinase [Lutimaribacter marinistellae]|uniref:histidine kinase n=1 Tax=Lutimaribacter marinistellae TaxID=1820329 RepID=A0ABV7TEB3_9RHOB
MPKDKETRPAQSAHDFAEIYEAALRTGRMGTWETDFAAGTRTWTSTAAAIFGIDVDEGVPIPFAERDHLLELMHPEDKPLLDRFRARLRREDEIEVSYRIRTETGEVRHVAGRGRVLDRAPDGTPTRVVHIITDVTAQRRIEEHNTMLMRELTHRSKNLLAIISAMARQTGRRAASFDEFRTSFERRLEGLARSTDLLVAQDWSETSLEELVKLQTDSFADPAFGRILIDGPALRIGADVAQPLGMALHELATNAVKYGSLSAREGRVHIDWDARTGDDGARVLHFHWRETGGPMVEKPQHTGFGTMVVETMIASMLDARVTYDLRPEGALWQIEAPLPPLEDVNHKAFHIPATFL